jgi:hypothetical protein
MNPEEHPAGKYDYLPTQALITRNSKLTEWPSFQRTFHEIRSYPERNEWDRQPIRPDLRQGII